MGGGSVSLDARERASERQRRVGPGLSLLALSGVTLAERTSTLRMSAFWGKAGMKEVAGSATPMAASCLSLAALAGRFELNEISNIVIHDFIALCC